MAKEKDLHDAFYETLKDVYFAEKRSVKACKKSAKRAQSPELKALSGELLHRLSDWHVAEAANDDRFLEFACRGVARSRESYGPCIGTSHASCGAFGR